jgi:hypothetical protein
MTASETNFPIEAGRFRLAVTDQRDRGLGYVAHLEVRTSHDWQEMDAVIGFGTAVEALLAGKRMLVTFLNEALIHIDLTADEIDID